MSRRISKVIENVVNNPLQTTGNRAKLTSVVEIKRPYTVLKDDYFLEKLEIDTGTHAITDVDIAVSHPRLAHPNDTIYISAISNGMARVYSAKTSYIMNEHKFVDLGYEIPATKVSLGFEAILEPNYRFDQERVTSDNPWLFYISPDGSLNGLDLNTNEHVVISSENAVDVSVVSGPWHWSTDFDYGMIVFFIINGMLMCRRLIKGKWYDAEVISFGPGGPYIGVTATITWDYRIAINVYKTNDESHTIFTNFLGLGKFSSEVVELNSTEYDATVIGMDYRNVYNNDTVRVTMDLENEVNLIGRGPSYPVMVENIKTTTVEWGHKIRITYNLPIVSDGFSANRCFELVDSLNRSNTNLTASRISTGEVEIIFDGFNDMVGECTLYYTPGVTKNEFLIPCEPWEYKFTPKNLNGNSVPYHYDTVELQLEIDYEANLIGGEKVPAYNTEVIDISIDLEYDAVITHISDM